jgi:four helix bundle protein
MSIKSFRDLRVWQAAMEFVEAVYHLTHMFPKHEVYGLASQTQRAVCPSPQTSRRGIHENT